MGSSKNSFNDQIIWPKRIIEELEMIDKSTNLIEISLGKVIIILRKI